VELQFHNDNAYNSLMPEVVGLLCVHRALERHSSVRAGIKVGVLSDSFNDLGGAAADEADGALPPASQIQILNDLPSGGTDEGRAMMQIIHDIAPGASLAFYTAAEGEESFAQAPKFSRTLKKSKR
jgi:hypothetical protein